MKDWLKSQINLNNLKIVRTIIQNLIQVKFSKKVKFTIFKTNQKKLKRLCIKKLFDWIFIY